MGDRQETANSVHPDRGVHLGDEPRNGPLGRGPGAVPVSLPEVDDLRAALADVCAAAEADYGPHICRGKRTMLAIRRARDLLADSGSDREDGQA